MADRFKDKEHLLRVAGIFAAALVLFLMLQLIFVPKDFGLYGHYRPGALDDIRARPVAFAGRETCEACHSEEAATKSKGKHAAVACEACHGALARHAEADDPEKAKPARPTAELCLVCHAANVAKPASFPQIKPKDHAEPGACLQCHKAHDPKL
jgi:hypothetical protein